jgi:hypothetical protein
MKIFLHSLIFFIFYIGSVFIFSFLSSFLIIPIQYLILISYISIVLWNIFLCINKKLGEIFEFFMIIILGILAFKIGNFVIKLF